MTTIPAGIPAHEVLALVASRKAKKADAIAYLQARVDAHVAAGRRPRYATRKALAELQGLADVPALPEGLATLSQASKARKAEAKAAAKPAKAKARTTRKAAPARKAAASNANPMADAIAAIAGLDDKALAAFLRAVAEARS